MSKSRWTTSCIILIILLVSSLHAQPLEADFDGNGAVNFADFILFAQAFGGTDTRFDLGGNGKVDCEDFVVFAAEYGSNATFVWTQLQFLGDRPGPLRNQALLFEPSGKRMFLFGGAESRAKSDTWHLDVNDDIWEQVSFQGQVPGARWSHNMVLDSARRRVLMWGGTSGSLVFEDLWELAF